MIPPPPAIVQKSCLSCHGPERPAGGIRLDTPLNTALAKKVLAAIHYEGAVKMPPSGKLPESDIAAIATWTKSIAPEKPHWAWQPLHPASGSIDSFIEAKLQTKGLTFSPEADRRTLIRRVTFDLTGLPPHSHRDCPVRF
ncbi:MAG: DUF1549 domain-containing protein [Armatimonas sp.]